MTTGHSSHRRYAQTYLAQRTGQLTRASVGLFANVAGANFDLELRAVDPATSKPGTVLASASIANVPATTNEDPPRTITGTFSSSAPVVAGRRYALAVVSKENIGYFALVNENTPCPDSTLFGDAFGDETFTELPLHGLVFATFVTS
jgi:hypothetical protein